MFCGNTYRQNYLQFAASSEGVGVQAVVVGRLSFQDEVEEQPSRMMEHWRHRRQHLPCAGTGESAAEVVVAESVAKQKEFVQGNFVL